MPEYDPEAMRKTADTLRRKAGHFGQVGDGLPRVEDEKAFGELANSPQLVSGVHGAMKSLSDQFSTAEQRLKEMSEAVARAADAFQAQDEEGARVVTPPEKKS